MFPLNDVFMLTDVFRYVTVLYNSTCRFQSDFNNFSRQSIRLLYHVHLVYEVGYILKWVVGKQFFFRKYAKKKRRDVLLFDFLKMDVRTIFAFIPILNLCIYVYITSIMQQQFIRLMLFIYFFGICMVFNFYLFCSRFRSYFQTAILCRWRDALRRRKRPLPGSPPEYLSQSGSRSRSGFYSLT